ncbi:unnamed protein product [Lactuca saligna]|uniref:Uncharacterized protein n=1 Tax=Lactuca saligna TaxID=75948 RepID=A0AA35Y939_LACSI|nr:unnamed protein product [Lactuca saligna]
MKREKGGNQLAMIGEGVGGLIAENSGEDGVVASVVYGGTRLESGQGIFFCSSFDRVKGNAKETNTKHEGKNEGIIDWKEEEIGTGMNRRQSRRRYTKLAKVRSFFWLKEGGPMASDFSSIDSQSVMASRVRLRPKKRKGNEEASRGVRRR